MATKLLPHAPSNGAKALANALGIKRLRTNGTSAWRPRPGDRVINWGRSQALPNMAAGFLNVRWINQPAAVSKAQSKLASLTIMKEGGVNVPEFTQDRSIALGWISGGYDCICRALDKGSAGRGITFVPRGSDPQQLPQVPLYTRYEPRRDEYRLHVFRRSDGTYSVVDIAQKRKRAGVEDVNVKVRTADNGWVYCREGVECPPAALGEATKAAEVLGLDFGAVDLGWTRTTSKATVFEVNTAPGLEGTTVQRYADAMRQLLGWLPPDAEIGSISPLGINT